MQHLPQPSKTATDILLQNQQSAAFLLPDVDAAIEMARFVKRQILTPSSVNVEDLSQPAALALQLMKQAEKHA